MLETCSLCNRLLNLGQHACNQSTKSFTALTVVIHTFSFAKAKLLTRQSAHNPHSGDMRWYGARSMKHRENSSHADYNHASKKTGKHRENSLGKLRMYAFALKQLPLRVKKDA